MDLEVDPRRYWSTIERSAEIGVGRPGGLARVALSDADRATERTIPFLRS